MGRGPRLPQGLSLHGEERRGGAVHLAQPGEHPVRAAEGHRRSPAVIKPHPARTQGGLGGPPPPQGAGPVAQLPGERGGRRLCRRRRQPEEPGPVQQPVEPPPQGHLHQTPRPGPPLPKPLALRMLPAGGPAGAQAGPRDRQRGQLLHLRAGGVRGPAGDPGPGLRDQLLQLPPQDHRRGHVRGYVLLVLHGDGLHRLLYQTQPGGRQEAYGVPQVAPEHLSCQQGLRHGQQRVLAGIQMSGNQGMLKTRPDWGVTDVRNDVFHSTAPGGGAGFSQTSKRGEKDVSQMCFCLRPRGTICAFNDPRRTQVE